MKRILCSLTVASLSFFSAQISVSEAFETTPTIDKGFIVDGFASSANPVGCSGRALSKNFWSANTNVKNTMVYTSDKSNGGKLSISFKYKHPGLSNSNPKVDGILKVEYSVNNGEYQLLNSYDLKTHQHGCLSYTKVLDEGTIPADKNFKLKISGTWVSGDFYIAIDDFAITQDAPTLSVDSVSNKQTAIYPNPVQNVINLTDHKSVKRLIIIDASGRVVRSIEQPTQATDISTLKSGNYIVSLVSSNGTTTSYKIIKK
ncbi:T9SS type A sorting domain-containing protein [Chryseobacterium sp. T1]